MSKNNNKDYNPLWIDIGLRINTLIAEKDKSQKALADYLRIKPNVVSYWCKGERTPNNEQIILIAKYFNVSTDFLLCKTKIETTDTDLRAICEYTGLSEKAIIRLQELNKVKECSVLSDLILDVDFPHLLYMIYKKIYSDGKRVINYGVGVNEISTLQKSFIDYELSQTINTISSRLQEKGTEKTFDNTDADIKFASIMSDSIIQRLNAGEINEEEYQNCIDEYENGNYNFNPHAHKYK